MLIPNNSKWPDQSTTCSPPQGNSWSEHAAKRCVAVARTACSRYRKMLPNVSPALIMLVIRFKSPHETLGAINLSHATVP
jgi:hypothetical protein